DGPQRPAHRRLLEGHAPARQDGAGAAARPAPADPHEPLSGIDPVGRQEFVALYRELEARGKCLLVSSHELDELEKLTDHVAVMARGRIAAVGTLTQIRDLLTTSRCRCGWSAPSRGRWRPP